MNTIIILLIFSVSLFVAFLLGRYTDGWGIPDKDKKMIQALKNTAGFRERTTFHSPSQKAKAKRDLENITNE